MNSKSVASKKNSSSSNKRGRRKIRQLRTRKNISDSRTKRSQTRKVTHKKKRGISRKSERTRSSSKKIMSGRSRSSRQMSRSSGSSKSTKKIDLSKYQDNLVLKALINYNSFSKKYTKLHILINKYNKTLIKDNLKIFLLNNNENIDLMKKTVEENIKIFEEYPELMSPIFGTSIDSIDTILSREDKKNILDKTLIYQVLYIKDLNTEKVSCFIGFTIRIFDKKIYLHIENSMTFPNYRRKGLSSILRLVLINFCVDNKFYKMTSNTNNSSKRLLIKMGFEKTKGPKIGRKWVRDPKTKKLTKDFLKDIKGNYIIIEKKISENGITFNMFIEIQYYIFFHKLFKQFKKREKLQI